MRVLVVDDHEVVRHGVKSLLDAHDGCEVCGEAVDGRDALEKARSLRPDVIVMDISMPNLNGLEATRLIRNELPNSEVLIMSQHDSPAMIREAFKAGARGYVVKSALGTDLLGALEKVGRRETAFDPAATVAKPSAHIDAQEILQRSAALENALRESEELYRSTFDLAAIGVAHVSPDGRWLRINGKLCEIVGYSEEELLKMKFQEITHPDDLAVDLAETEKIISGAIDTFSMEKRYIRKDGSVVWVNLTVSAVRNGNNQLKHFISVVEDISGRREAEETRAKLAAIVSSSNDAIISKDLNGIIKSWNDAAQRIFEYTAEEVIGLPITILIPPELHQEEKEILKRLRNGEQIEHFDTVRVTKSGKRLNISLTVSPVKDATGKIVGASKIARDVTEQKRMAEALQQRNR
jgi:PAS domain S-box-containing protein